MTGLDTNVLVRLFTRDDERQLAQAKKLFAALSADAPGWVSTVVLLELNWVLSSVYRCSKEQVLEIMELLLAMKEIVVENDEVIWRALRQWRGGKADFADCLITASARVAGCERTVTFDQRAARDAGMELLA